MPVTSVHTEYANAADRWRLVRDCVKGQDAVKDGTTLYLPKPNPTDESKENETRYDQYLQRAMFLGVTGRTKNGLIGAIFRKPAHEELPSQIDYMQEDCDGGGQSLTQLGKWLAGELLETGRAGLLADYPEAPQGLSEAEVRANNLRPMIVGYPAESILNWKFEKRGGKEVLTLVVLHETAEDAIDEYESDEVSRYRVLRLTDEGYVQELFDRAGQSVVEPIEPRDANGARWQEIPFVLCGSENNKPGVDPSPLYDLASANIAHYRNSADHEENLFVHAQGTLFINPGEMSAEQFNEANPNGVEVGSRRGHILGNGGSASLVQIAPSTALGQALKDKEEQMIAIGARLITAKSGNQTAEEARINASGESSVLSNLTGNASEGIEQALEYAAIFAGANPEEIVFELNMEFFDAGYDPQAAAAKMQEINMGLIAKPDYRAWLRRIGELSADRTDEDIESEAEAVGLM